MLCKIAMREFQRGVDPMVFQVTRQSVIAQKCARHGLSSQFTTDEENQLVLIEVPVERLIPHSFNNKTFYLEAYYKYGVFPRKNEWRLLFQE